MGVSLPELPVSHSEENINLGDKDSIRRRALWALEGKTDSSFSPVEIPELNSTEVERRIFEFPSKPSYPPGIGGSYGSGLSGLANKRDSFGKHLVSSSVSKDQLHTLIEEEEEEEEQDVPVTPVPTASPADVVESPVEIVTPLPSPPRHRPAGLNLRPLSLTPQSIVTTVDLDGLPTPDLTPSPSKSSGLRSLTLGSSPSLISSPSPSTATTETTESATSSSTAASRRRSFILPSVGLPNVNAFRRSSLNLRRDSVSSISSETAENKRRSSICYKPSRNSASYGLPTPDLTPTTDRRISFSSDSEWDGDRSFPSEQQFLYQSHAALLSRITDLERALSSSRTHSRPVSYASDASAQSITSEPSDEMLRLIADLKAERDELKKDVDGWRVRVADLEKQRGLLANRVDLERREAWVARERVGLLEIEKRAVAKDVEEKTAFAEEMVRKYEVLQAECNAINEERDRLLEQVKGAQETETECARLREQLAEETSRREELERELEGAGLLNTPTPDAFEFRSAAATSFIRRRGLGLQSVDSESSFTDVESVDGLPGKSFELNAVIEEEEHVFSDEDNGLAGYEDEEEFDESFESPGGSSIASMDDLRPSTSHLKLEMPTSAPIVHPKKLIVSSDAWRIWRIPPPASSTTTMGNPFAKGFAIDSEDDDMPPFFIPSDVGIEVVETAVLEAPATGLDSVIEEEEPEEEESEEEGLSVVDEEEEQEEEEFIGEEVEGGIKFTFTIPPAFDSPVSTEFVRTPSPPRSPTRKLVPVYEPSTDDEDSFSFQSQSAPMPIQKSPTPGRSPANVSPSSIPRATALKRFETPTKIPAPQFGSPRSVPSSFMTPPTKRGGTQPSFIPQPRRELASPSSSPRPSAITPPKFVPQPQRKSVTTNTSTRIKLQSPNGVTSHSGSSFSTPNPSLSVFV
ncbi:hypothetical protein EWM64_g1490 [Hericium alpestre]|uniref:Uncharacterized protein n=1 Tax=Hericium alpestre TaxID=135208 RepID=A0A4Z0A8C4_9AGAM|nr:hypothetical protein EWM64_g1490 [Hericium alpestre]